MCASFSDCWRTAELLRDCGVNTGPKDWCMSYLADELKSKRELTPFSVTGSTITRRGNAVLTTMTIAVPVLPVPKSSEKTVQEIAQEKAESLVRRIEQVFPIVTVDQTAWKDNLTSELNTQLRSLNVVLPAIMIRLTVGREYEHCKHIE